MLVSLIVLAAAAAGCLVAYAQPRAFIVAFVSAMFVLPPLFFQVGVRLGAEGRYLSILVLFSSACIAVYLFRIATGSLRPIVIDAFPLLYLFIVLISSIAVRGGGLDPSYLALYTRTTVVPLAFY